MSISLSYVQIAVIYIFQNNNVSSWYNFCIIFDNGQIFNKTTTCDDQF